MPSDRIPVPRDSQDDYTPEIVEARQDFVKEQTGTVLDHTGQYSFDPSLVAGNTENFTGVAQVPIGLAGPLTVDGEYARGDFYVPMATTEGTLVASYSRGMRLLSECGGVKTTIIEQFMQRSPVFLFDDARQARDFGDWLDRNLPQISEVAESTTNHGKLSHIQHFAIGNMLYLRFNYTTGDAAGQNMVSKATLAACEWIQDHYPTQSRYLISGSIDTDKKHSHMNVLHTRGKRVIAEAVIRNDVVQRVMRVDTASLNHARHISATGAVLCNSANNGSHAANGLAALFIATGQDAANVAESHAGIVHVDLRDNGDYYWSITLPSLIVGTYGGGTGLATQRESLEMLGCYGTGGANKFAEICAATVLAGETSLASAQLSGDWIASHDRLGRNRP